MVRRGWEWVDRLSARLRLACHHDVESPREMYVGGRSIGTLVPKSTSGISDKLSSPSSPPSCFRRNPEAGTDPKIARGLVNQREKEPRAVRNAPSGSPKETVS
jgi:hypothetical protein